MKRAFLYIGIMCAAAITLSTAYYISYKKTLEKYQSEHQAEVVDTIPDQTVALPSPVPEVVETDTAKEDLITNKTKLIVITNDLKNNSYVEEEHDIVTDWIGKNREELEQYLSKYMSDLPLNEVREGLISYDLQSFSPQKVVVIKNYDSDKMPYEYFVTVINYEVVVYYCDQKTIFEYTGIDARNLSVDEQNNLLKGIFVKDQEELYGMLENYSS